MTENRLRTNRSCASTLWQRCASTTETGEARKGIWETLALRYTNFTMLPRSITRRYNFFLRRISLTHKNGYVRLPVITELIDTVKQEQDELNTAVTVLFSLEGMGSSETLRLVSGTHLLRLGPRLTFPQISVDPDLSLKQANRKTGFLGSSCNKDPESIRDCRPECHWTIPDQMHPITFRLDGAHLFAPLFNSRNPSFPSISFLVVSTLHLSSGVGDFVFKIPAFTSH